MAVNYNSKIITDGLIFSIDIANKRSYPGNGNTLYDLSINKNIGVLNNGPTYSSENGGSIIFDGINDWINFEQNASYNIGSGNFSIFCWMKSSYKSNYGTLFSLDNSATGNGILFYTTASTGAFRTWIGGYVRNTSIDICNNMWNFVGVSRNSGVVTQYINCISNGTFNAASSVISNQNLRLGSYDGNGYRYNGNISNIVMYNKALTQLEILQNFNATRGRYLV